MNREQLIQWIRQNDKVYEYVDLFYLSDEELLYLKREIKMIKAEQWYER